MANEIKVNYPETGLSTLTAKVYKPDGTIRDGQTSISLSDSGHPGLYLGNAVVYAGDIIQIWNSNQIIGADLYRPVLTEESIIQALKASTGWTAGNTYTLAQVIKILAAWSAGQWVTGSGGAYNVRDIENTSTNVLSVALSQSSPYKIVTIL